MSKIATSTVPVSTSSDVSHDTSKRTAIRVPTTKSGVAANVKTSSAGKTRKSVTVNSKSVAANSPILVSGIEQLQAMEASRLSWETNELAASNKRLYSILETAYTYYWDMKKNPSDVVRKDKVNGINEHIAKRGYQVISSTHDMTKVVKCVFGEDRRRASAYSIALRYLLSQDIQPSNVAKFLDDVGGVEKARQQENAQQSPATRAASVKDEVIGTELGLVKLDASLVRPDAEWIDKQVVIVATYLPTGEYKVNAVVQHDSAVTAALAAFSSKQASDVRAQAKAERDEAKQTESFLRQMARKNHANAEKAKTKQKKNAAKVEKERLEDEHKAGALAAFNRLVETD
ncbi:hypothetical protein N9F12_01310 [Burkholderiaceae bacterium]|nr:hypothetical protein [Burkholderiaceae bacterium]